MNQLKLKWRTIVHLKHLITLTAVALVLNLPWTGASLQAAAPQVLKSAGCKTEYFLLQDLTKPFTDRTGTKLQLGNTGNKKAVHLLMDRKIDFAFTCETIEQLAGKLQLDPEVMARWKSVPIAKDPIVIVSSRGNGVGNLTSAQLADVFQGKIRNWREIGGNDLPVRVAYINPELESGVTLLFEEFILEAGNKLAADAHVGDGPSMVGNYVSLTPGAVTFIGLNSYQEKFGEIVAIDGVHPTRENIISGHYGLAATYYLTLAGDNNADVSEFLDFVRSEEGRAAIEVNFIPFSQ